MSPKARGRFLVFPFPFKYRGGLELYHTGCHSDSLKESHLFAWFCKFQKLKFNTIQNTVRGIKEQ